MSGMLFDTSPEETEQSGKKKPRKKAAEAVSSSPGVAAEREYPAEARYLATIHDHFTCDWCGMKTLDLVEERLVDGQKKWVVQCGLWCLTSWVVDPVPGILDREDEKQKSSGKAFVVKGGRFDGKTFDEIAAAGHRNHIVGLAEKGREYLAAAAKEWLSRNGG